MCSPARIFGPYTVIDPTGLYTAGTWKKERRTFPVFPGSFPGFFRQFPANREGGTPHPPCRMVGWVTPFEKKRGEGGGGHPLPPLSAKTCRLFHNRIPCFVWKHDEETNSWGISFLAEGAVAGPERGGGYPPACPAHGWGGDPLMKKRRRGGRGYPLPPCPTLAMTPAARVPSRDLQNNGKLSIPRSPTVSYPCLPSSAVPFPPIPMRSSRSARPNRPLASVPAIRFYEHRELEEWITAPKENLLFVLDEGGEIAGFFFCKIMSSHWAYLDNFMSGRRAAAGDTAGS